MLLTDRFFAGSDTLATSYALASAIAKIGEVWGKPDIVFTGKQTIDGDTAQVGPGIAKRLDLNQLTYVAKIADIDLSGGALTVERRAEGGTQVLKTKLPVLVTMLEGTNDMRRGSMEDAFRAARAEIVKWSAKDAGIEDLGKCGLKGSPTVVKRVFAPAARADKAHIVDISALKGDAVGEAIMGEIFTRLPAIEDELQKMAAGY